MEIKLVLIIMFVGLSQLSFAQDNEELFKTALKKEFPVASNKSERWVFEDEISNIEQINNAEIQNIIAEYNLFKVKLTNYLGYHISESYCLTLFNYKTSEIILIEPLWYSGINSNLLKLFIGLEFQDKDSILKYIFSLQDIMLVGSTGIFKNTIFDSNKITFDLTNMRNNKNDVWRHIEVGIQDNKILYFKSTNPKTGNSIKIN